MNQPIVKKRWKRILGGAIAAFLCLPVFPSVAVNSVPSPSPLVEKPSQNRQADQLLQQGNQQYQAGKLEDALKSWQAARSQYQQLQDRPGEASALANIGAAYTLMERYREAVATLEALLPLAQALNLTRMEAEAQGNLGPAYASLGNYSQAIDAHRKAGKLMRALGDRQGLGQVLLNLGNTFEAVGDYDNARTAYEQSLKLAQQTGDRLGEAIAQSNLGALYANLGQSDDAIKALKQGLDLAKANGNQSSQASTLINLGSVYHSQKEIEKAIGYYQQSLAIAQQSQQRQRQAEALGSLGIAYEDKGDYPKALKFLQQSLDIVRTIGNPQLEGRSLNNLGHTLFGAGKLTEAETQLRAAAKLLDGIRPGLSDTYQVSIFDTQVQTYNLLQQVLIAANQPEAALEISEQGRARAFVELLSRRLVQPSNQKAINSNAQIPTLGKLKQIARQQNATLVEYAIVIDDDFKFRGKQRSREQDLYIWVVSPSGQIAFRQVDLKPLWQQGVTLSELVNASRCLNGSPGCNNLIKSVSAESGTSNRNKELTFPEVPLPTDSTTPSQDVQENSALQRLHSLLIEPISGLLPTDPNARVIFIPQESLFLAPFPALQDESGQYLIERHTILSAPAIQVLDLTHQQRQQARGRKQAPPLVVGNPVMPMVSTALGQPPGQLAPLPNAEEEAHQVAQLLNTVAITGSQATKASIKQKLPQAPLIHLATHGLLEYGSQGNYVSLEGIGVPGAIALAPSGNDSGLLTASEILDLQLQAELVVLSACETGRGRITGDGVVGLSRAFISAGVPSVVVSLWAVPDDATAQLMVAFYKNLKHSPDRAQALRQAMLATMKDHPSPFDWAAFTLIGEAE
ncbi:CHAT domain-containing tetratricopeptide repeat protein [Trichocoleus sp. FACHB-262]|uniref:CHAT domain-containing protein n=1 Tax=Trichocoleus sp. FACHB-262 TaxID=2692869 RepID=UPI001684D1AD|nr:CHAT domain-containing tetratricopeptide repeat protein [Trichocoleus sp. FACHB-262]MBD2122369.1 CHAT domain-containing protein [Trichocoleus sp. FACHB-262]